MDKRMKTHGDLGCCDLMTDDADRACAFYAEVIGWNTEDMNVGMGPYTVFKAGDRPVVGLMRKPPDIADAPTAWTCYVTVDDVDACVARATEAGGSVIAAPVDIPTVGRVAIIQDPTGGRIGVATYLDEDG